MNVFISQRVWNSLGASLDVQQSQIIVNVSSFFFFIQISFADQDKEKKQ